MWFLRLRLIWLNKVASYTYMNEFHLVKANVFTLLSVFIKYENSMSGYILFCYAARKKEIRANIKFPTKCTCDEKLT